MLGASTALSLQCDGQSKLGATQLALAVTGASRRTLRARLAGWEVVKIALRLRQALSG